MSKISDYTINEILDKVSLVDIINKYTQLKPSGQNFVGNCIFQNNEEPALIVMPKHKLYKCNTCGSMGNVLVFLMELEGLDFSEAAEKLAAEAGIEVITTKETDEIKKSDLYRVLEDAMHIYQDEFWNSPQAAEARAYLQQRGFTNDILQKHKIGFAPEINNWNFLIRRLATKYDFPLLERAGLVFKSNKTKKFYDYFRNRILFPWFDIAGRPIGFGGRTMSPETEETKYLNTRQTPVFEKQKNLYLLNIARKIHLVNDILLVEGYTDCLMAHQEGQKNTVATAGTAFTRQHAVLLKRITNKVLVGFDPDSAGKENAITAAKIMQAADLDARIVNFPTETDPADFIKDALPGELKQKLEESIPLMEFALEQALHNYSSDYAIDKARVLKELAPFIRAAPDAPTCKTFIDEIAKRLNLQYDTVAEFIDHSSRHRMPEEIKLSPFPTKIQEQQIALLLLRKPAYRNYLTMELSAEQFNDSAIRALFSYFCSKEAKDDAINFQNGIQDVPSLFDKQYTENLPGEIAAHARKNKQDIKESDIYLLVSRMQRTPAPSIPAELIVRNFLRARYRQELQELSIEIASAHNKRDRKLIEQLIPEYNALLQKLRSSSKDSLK